MVGLRVHVLTPQADHQEQTSRLKLGPVHAHLNQLQPRQWLTVRQQLTRNHWGCQRVEEYCAADPIGSR